MEKQPGPKSKESVFSSHNREPEPELGAEPGFEQPIVPAVSKQEQVADARARIDTQYEKPAGDSFNAPNDAAYLNSKRTDPFTRHETPSLSDQLGPPGLKRLLHPIRNARLVLRSLFSGSQNKTPEPTGRRDPFTRPGSDPATQRKDPFDR